MPDQYPERQLEFRTTDDGDLQVRRIGTTEWQAASQGVNVDGTTVTAVLLDG